MRGPIATLGATLLLACGAARGAVPGPIAVAPAAPPPPARFAACEDHPTVVVLDPSIDPTPFLGDGIRRLLAHRSGAIETGTRLPATLAGVARIDDAWYFACTDARVYRASSFVGALSVAAELPAAPVVPTIGGARGEALVLQRGALGVTLADGRAIRFGGDGSIAWIESSPARAALFAAPDVAGLVLVGGGLARWAAGRTVAVPLGVDGQGAVSAITVDDSGLAVTDTGGTASRDGVAIESERVACDPDGRLAPAVADARAADDRATPVASTAGRDVFDDGDHVTLRIVDHASGALVGRAVLPSEECELEGVGEGLFATCPGEAGEDGEGEPPLLLLRLDDAMAWVELARAGEIRREERENDASVWTCRTWSPGHERTCFVVASGTSSCFDVTTTSDDTEGPDAPALCDDAAIALRFTHRTAVALVSVDLATGARTEVPIPATLRSGTWSVGGDDLCVATRAARDGTRTDFEIVDGRRLAALPPRAPRVIRLDEIACCFGAHELSCTTSPRADAPAPRAWIEDDGASAIAVHVRDATTALPRDAAEAERSFVLGLAALGDGSVRGARWTGSGARRFVVDPAGVLDESAASASLPHGPITLGGVVVEVERRERGDVVTTWDQASGRRLAARTLNDGGPLGRMGTTLGVVIDDVFVPLDPAALPVRLPAVPDAVADFDCRWPPPCAAGSVERGAVEYFEGGVLSGLDEAAWIGVERAGEASCIREVVTVYGEVLARSQSGFVGPAIRAGAVVDAVCAEAPPS